MAKIIGIADTCAEGIASVGTNYPNAVLRAGHIPVLLPQMTDEAMLRQLVGNIDALLLPGGGADVNPALYRAPLSPYCGNILPERDAFEYRLIEAAVLLRKPIFGICRGLQIINTYFGGTLYQDLPTEKGLPLQAHSRPDLEWDEVHPISITPGSNLAQILGTTQVYVNSTHHQACRQVAPGFRVTALAPDGVIEGIESESLPILCVQFHPERLINLSGGIFTRLFTTLPEWRTPESEYEKYRRMQTEQFEDDITEGRCYPEMPEGQFVRSK